MKKTVWAAAAFALSAAGYAAASWWTGQQIEQHHAAEFDRAIPMMGTGDVVSREYDRGWFTSKARTVVEFEVPEELFKPLTKERAAEPQEAPAESAEAPVEPATRTIRVHLQDDIRHGPLPGWRLAAAIITTRLTQVEGLDDATRQAFAAATAPSMHTVYGFDGRFDGDFVLPAGEMRHPQLRAQWQGFDAKVHGMTEGNQVQGTMRWPQLTLASDADPATGAVAVQMLMTGLSGEFDVRQARDQPAWFATQGDFKGRIDEVSFRRMAGGGAPPAAPLLAMNGITLDSKSALDGALLNMRLRLAARGSVAGLKIDALQFDSALDRLDTQALAIMQNAPSGTAEPTPPATEGQPQPPEGQAIEQLLAAKPTYATKLTATIGDQKGEIGYRFAVADAQAEAQLKPSAQRPAGSPVLLLALLSRQIEGEANVRLPKSWVPAIADAINRPSMTAASFKALLDGLVRQRLLVDEPQAWRADLKLAQGAMLLNGKPFTGMVPGR